MNLTYTNTITADEINFIRKSVGFRQIHTEQLEAGLKGSKVIVAVYDQNRSIGFARLIWDGGCVALIPDLLVIPEYQMQGIEENMINHIFNFLREKLKPGYGIQVDVRAWNNESLLKSFGFQVSTVKKRGLPMHICLTNQVELTDAMFEQSEF